MKVCVYAIAKNEEKFALRWIKSMSEADEIIVLDTGSTDRTVEILRQNGAKVFEEEIIPWRFDVARNRSLELVPNDAEICVCTDIDEVFSENWRQKVENAWKKDVTRLSYRYVWNFTKDGEEGTVFWSNKIHSRQGYKWVSPVHETLSFVGENEVFNEADGVCLKHYADDEKSRSQYLPLLELAVKEDPENDRNMHYLGREYMFNKKYDLAISTLKKHLKLKSSAWRDERAASMRFIARCLVVKGEFSKAYKYFLLAICEAPHLRETWLDMAYFEYDRQNWLGCAYFIEYALTIQARPKTYITEARSWDATPYDILSIAYYHIGDVQKAISSVKKAIKLSDDKRLRDNLKIYEGI